MQKEIFWISEKCWNEYIKLFCPTPQRIKFQIKLILNEDEIKQWNSVLTKPTPTILFEYRDQKMPFVAYKVSFIYLKKLLEQSFFLSAFWK